MLPSLPSGAGAYGQPPTQRSPEDARSASQTTRRSKYRLSPTRYVTIALPPTGQLAQNPDECSQHRPGPAADHRKGDEVIVRVSVSGRLLCQGRDGGSGSIRRTRVSRSVEVAARHWHCAGLRCRVAAGASGPAQSIVPGDATHSVGWPVTAAIRSKSAS
jgi:hypothetical protein